MSSNHKLIWSDIAGHRVVVCPKCNSESEPGSANYESLKHRGICLSCHREQDLDNKG